MVSVSSFCFFAMPPPGGREHNVGSSLRTTAPAGCTRVASHRRRGPATRSGEGGRLVDATSTRCLTGAAEADADVGERRRAAAEDRERARERPAEEGAPAQQRTGLAGGLRARQALIVTGRADARTPRAASRHPPPPPPHPLL